MGTEKESSVSTNGEAIAILARATVDRISPCGAATLSQQGRLMVAECSGFGGQHSCSGPILVPMVRQRWAAIVGSIQTAPIANATSRATTRANISCQYKEICRPAKFENKGDVTRPPRHDPIDLDNWKVKKLRGAGSIREPHPHHASNFTSTVAL